MEGVHQLLNYSTWLYSNSLLPLSLVENLIFHAKTKHGSIPSLLAGKKVLLSEIELECAKTSDQAANIFRRGIGTTKSEEFQKPLGMVARSALTEE